MKFLPILITLLLVFSAVPVDATLVVNKYTNDFTLSSPNNEQLKVCACGLKTDTLIIENVGNFYANYAVDITSDAEEWMTISEAEFSLPPKHRKEILVFVETPCGSVGTYDYVVTVTSSYGRSETLQRTLRADQCQNLVMSVVPEKTINNLCQPVEYDITVKNVGTYGETYELGFGSYDEYMNVSIREFYLKPGQEFTQTSTLTLPCTWYGDYDIPFIAYADKNRVEKEVIVPLIVENQFDHSIAVDTQHDVCSQVSQYIPVTVTNEIDVANDFKIFLDGPGFVDVENNERMFSLEGGESTTFLLETTPKEGQEGVHELNVEVVSTLGDVEKSRTLNLDVKNCYGFDAELRNINNEPITEQTTCCGSHEYYLNVRNTGQTHETYNILVDGPSWFAAEELTVDLRPGENKNVRILSETPCTDDTFVIPVTVVNNRYKEVNETVVFTLNTQTERTCHAVHIDDDEFRIMKDATVVPVVVKHNGTEGGIYTIDMESQLFSIAEEEVFLAPGERAVIHLEAKNLTELDFGRYISMPTFTYSAENNPLAHVSEDIPYVEHLGTQLRDKNLIAKLFAWISDNVCKPGFCGWLGIVLLIVLLLLAIFLMRGGRFEAKENEFQLLRTLLFVGIVIVLIALAVIKMPSADELYVMPENPDEYFVTIFENGEITVDLNEYFVDPDMDVLEYVATQPKDVAASIQENTLTLKADYGFTGENEIVITANDGNGGYEDSPVLTIYVIPEREMSFLSWWHRYCTVLNLWLLLLILLFLLIALTSERKEKKNVVVTKRNGKRVAARKVRKTPKKVATAKKAAKTRKLSAAHKAKISKALDRSLVSQEEHELKQVLDTHNKRGTKKNVEILGAALTRFKSDKNYKNTREQFYQYLKDKRVLARLEGKVIRNKPISAPKKTMSKAQKEKISKALDKALVSSEPHELIQVLHTHGKRGTERNIKIIGQALADFKKGRFKPKNRERFYQYLKEANVLRRLHNRK